VSAAVYRSGMESARASVTRVRRAVLPGPWDGRVLRREAVLLFLLGGLSLSLEVLAGSSAPRCCAVVGAVVLLAPLRRNQPGSVLVLAAGLAAAPLAGGWPLLIVAAWSAGRRIARASWTAAAFAGAFGVSVVVKLGTSAAANGISPPASVAVWSIAFLVMALAPGMFGRYRRLRRSLLGALQDRNAQLMRERALVAHQARLRERDRIARDMHDSLGHQLALIAVHVGALEVDRRLTDRQREVVAVLRQATATAANELRSIVGVLHEDSQEAVESVSVPALGPVPASALRTADIAAMVAASGSTGTQVELVGRGPVRLLTPVAAHAAYRLVQEGLTNAHKHAPGAPISVSLCYEPDSLLVEVANGPAPATARSGASVVGGRQGLTGLCERARLAGGIVHAGPTPAGGFRLAAVLPYENATPVDTEEDFRQQPGEAPDVESGPDIPWTTDTSELAVMTRSRKKFAVGCAFVATAVVLAVLAAVCWGGYMLIEARRISMVTAGTYQSLKIGTSERDAMKSLPSGTSVLTKAVQAKAPAGPAGSVCRYYLNADATSVAYEFCFKDGTLVAKQSYHA
jgi:signal transduction histidine kinase